MICGPGFAGEESGLFARISLMDAIREDPFPFWSKTAAEAAQVLSGRGHSSGAIDGNSQTGIFLARLRIVKFRAIRLIYFTDAGRRVFHVKGGKDPLIQEIDIFLSRYLFDDHFGQCKAVIAIEGHGARIMLQIGVFERIQQELMHPGIRFISKIEGRTGKTGRMIEEHPHGYPFVAFVLHRKFRNIPCNGFIQRHFPLLDEQENSNRNKHRAGRTDIETGVPVDGPVLCTVRNADTFRIDDPALVP